ncbi:MAG: hypothetical protein A3B74_05395 [Candidatus Kerfeldbacteria bacterium RIFCSPHIGHO2_02_FULL_42_14]|uniref:DAGKc domain-containing protein n=1 Tax=Candidatus Kerfeldbacteria bacterium RIFCSPHIGHO2_02_FULL_42_14 TaxID=1798540 RepID=A0A1G2AT20_9BACT|nr:MAG: hypothetical protein A3B74_05395 [Candidatus Kerfeldbacteria bacterium RIFCSPHIGHO2_02_FULL_42_14]OGY81577.1 MAG: hypothetical protein A3E60_01845 [Candidatus Kerfeldbacteria bacterium RIFCSPHIGHO2_12_FULL_42_13]OGY83178.1 MAG: hypothetical protein A3I91_03260 [Candidatus Kerfeldbacteria bacterium RIFCSPLOWO2_02_FULL_42_19]OGY86269.1 MAG: hypothetical protein A3G01_00360 [Candidatus Kerfeldbacteria bacterium RIFCSPLOWO2_12_FULL_43_9]
MYFYFYDTFLAASKYHSVLSKIEARLMNLGITGKIGRCSPLKSSRDLLFDAVKLGLKNIIVVGNDKTFYRALRDIVEKDVTLGYIPMEKHSMLAPIFGIPLYENACDVISKRIVELVDVGKINDHYFFTRLQLKNARVSLECDGRYKISYGSECRNIMICNLGMSRNRVVTNHTRHNCKDGFLEAVIEHTSRISYIPWFTWRSKYTSARQSVFPFQKIYVCTEEKPATIVADDDLILKTPAKIEVLPRKQKIIVGKDRSIQ